MTRKNALTFRLLSDLLEEAVSRKRKQSGHPQRHDQHSIFLQPGLSGKRPALQRRQALDRLGMKPEMRETEAAPEQVGALLPALAIDGEIVVSGVEPSVRELEILFEDHAQEGEEDSACGACGMECGGVNGTEHCPMCGQHGEGGSVAGRIIGFVILLIILFLAVKILS